MAAVKAPPTKPALENFYSVSAAAVRLGLRAEDDDSKKGEKWLRDGVNQKGWPCHRMAGQLLFSDSDLAEIAQLSRNAPQGRTRHPRTARKRTASRPATAAA
ncbi:hypothetical protein [Streptomyces sp. NPDC059015]|uniref:hypothetical protein n=1 Tax=unclassified Streptomyces TaxID=2593676 RepID=UPI00368F4294